MPINQTLLGGTIAAIMLAAPAFADVTDEGEAKPVNETVVTENEQEARSPAAIQFDVHFAYLGSTTGTRIERDGTDLSRPVHVISGDTLREDWLR